MGPSINLSCFSCVSRASPDYHASEYLKYVRKECFSTAFCPGCGHGILLNTFVTALGGLDFDQDNLVVVSGIGCGAWIGSPHLNVDTLHTTHGRAIALRTGVKMANN